MISAEKKLSAGILLLAFIFALAAAPASADGNFSDSNKTVHVFYSTHCSACIRAMPVIEKAAAQFPKATVNYYNIDLSKENMTLFFDFSEHYNIPFPSYPVIYAGDTIVLEGFNAISTNIDEVFFSIENGLIPDINYEKRWQMAPAGPTPAYNGAEYSKSDLNLFLVLSAGLLDGVNPCAFAVLVFLLMALTAAGTKKRAAFTGFSYIAGVYIIYILSGIGIMSVVAVSGLSFQFSIIAGGVAVAVGLIGIMEGFLRNNSKSLGIPESSKKFISDKIKKASIPGAFVLGIIVGVFELPCTGGIYLAVLGLLSSEMTFFEGLPYLILYNIMFVMPLIIIVLLVFFGLSPASADKFREEHKIKLKIAIGTALVLIGIFVLYRAFA